MVEVSQAVPVIVSNAGAPPELVKNDADGFIINPNNLEKWKVILEKLIKYQNQKQIGKAGRKNFKNFSAQQMATNYKNFFCYEK